MPDFNAFDKLLDQQDQYFQKAENEKLQTEAAADKVAASVKYFKHPLASDEQIYKNWIADQQAKKDEVTKIYQTKGVQAGQTALERYKRDLINDMQSGTGHMLNSNYETGLATMKQIQENYKDDPQVANYYAYGEGAKDWINQKDGKTSLTNPNYLPYIKDEERNKMWQEAAKNIPHDKNSVLGYLKDGTPIEVRKRLELLDDPYNYLMEEGTREWVDVNKVNQSLMSTLSPRLLQSMELEGRVRHGRKGIGDINNLMKYYVFDKEGNLVKDENEEDVIISPNDQAKYDKYAANPDLKVVQSFNPNNPFGNQLRNIANSHAFDRVSKNYTIVDNGLKHQQSMQMQQQKEANDNYWKKLNYQQAERKLQQDAPVVIPMKTSSGVYQQQPSYGKTNDNGEFEVTNQSIEDRKNTLLKRSNEIAVTLMNPNNGLTSQQRKAISDEKDAATKELQEINFINDEFDKNAGKMGVKNPKEVRQLVEQSGWQTPMDVVISGQKLKLSPEEISKKGLFVTTDGKIMEQPTGGGGMYGTTGSARVVGETSNARQFLNARKVYQSSAPIIDAYVAAKNGYLKEYTNGSTLTMDNHPFNNNKYDKPLQATTAHTLNNQAGNIEIKWTGTENEISTLDDMTVKMGKTIPKGYTLSERRLKSDQEFYFSTTPMKHGNQNVGATGAIYQFVYKSKGSPDIVIDKSALIPTKNLRGDDNYSNEYFDAKYQQPDMQAQGIIDRTKGQPTALLYDNKDFRFFKRNDKYYKLDKVSGKEYESNQTEINSNLQTQLINDARR